MLSCAQGVTLPGQNVLCNTSESGFRKLKQKKEGPQKKDQAKLLKSTKYITCEEKNETDMQCVKAKLAKNGQASKFVPANRRFFLSCQTATSLGFLLHYILCFPITPHTFGAYAQPQHSQMKGNIYLIPFGYTVQYFVLLRKDCCVLRFSLFSNLFFFLHSELVSKVLISKTSMHGMTRLTNTLWCSGNALCEKFERKRGNKICGGGEEQVGLALPSKACVSLEKASTAET